MKQERNKVVLNFKNVGYKKTHEWYPRILYLSNNLKNLQKLSQWYPRILYLSNNLKKGKLRSLENAVPKILNKL